MAPNFRITSRQNRNEIHLSLMGDFDGASAFELISAIKALNVKNRRVVVNTSGLSCIHPFGLNVFQKNCFERKIASGLTFTGTYRNAIESL